MRKIPKSTIFIVIILALCITQGLFAVDVKGARIAYAKKSELEEMCLMRGLAIGEENAMRESLYAYEGLQSYVEESAEDSEDGYALEVVAADTSESLQGDIIRLKGNVEISFKFSNEETPKHLYADMLLMDPPHKKLTALGNVRYVNDDKDAALGTIEADVVTFLWNTGDLVVSGGVTQSERKNNEDEAVTFYTSGDEFAYRADDGALFFQNGYITSNKENAYSSITAKKLGLLGGGDMFLSNAYLSLGRVPLLWVPFFFFPGSRMVGNPAIGITSSRGMFLSTTWELFGSYGKMSENGDMSSFAALLQSDESGLMRSNGVYYESVDSEDDLTALARWAEKSKSYFVVLADFYQNTGMNFGYDTLLKTSSLTFSSTSSMIFAPPLSISGDKRERFYSSNEMQYKSDWGSLALKLPFYSDPYVLRDYANRLTSFSIDSIFGASQSFPSTYSTVSSYTSSLTGSLSLPKKYATTLIDTLSLSSLNASVLSTWKYSDKEFRFSDITLASGVFKMGGTLLSFGKEKKTGEQKKTEEVDVKVQMEQKDAVSDFFVLNDSLLEPLYRAKLAQAKQTNTGKSSASLTYNLTETFSNTYDVDSTDHKSWINNVISSNSVANVVLDANIQDRFTIKNTVTPSYYYTYNEENKNYRADTSSLQNALAVSLPKLGFSYALTTKLYQRKVVSKDDTADVIDNLDLGWNADTVTQHSLSFSHAFATTVGSFTPSITYTIPPLTAALTPQLSYSFGVFIASGSWKFQENSDTGVFESDLAKLSLGITAKYFVATFSSEYESAAYDSADFWSPFSFKASATLRSGNKKWSIGESIEMDMLDSGVRNEVKSLLTTLQIPFVTMKLNFKDFNESLDIDYLKINTSYDRHLFAFWKNRVVVGFGFKSDLSIYYQDMYSSSLTLQPQLIFVVQKFLDIRFSFKTVNNGFYKYKESGNSFLSSLWDDFWRSLDFFGNGRSATQFVMEEAAFELTHYMDDWDLHCKYSASVVLSDSKYSWVPKISIYLRWKTMPDLKVDENWKKENEKWADTGSSKD